MKAIGYIRVSTIDQASEGVSLGAQKAKVKAYADLHGMELLDIFEENYDDTRRGKASAKSLKNRPQAQSAINMITSKKAEVLIVYKLDRLFRNTADALVTAQAIDKAGGSLHSVTERLDTSSSLGRFFFTILAAFAEMERNLIAERTTEALRHKRATGLTFNQAPYGWDNMDGKLVRNEAEQIVITQMREFYNNGFSYQGIINILLKGIETKTGKRWHASTIKKILEANK